MIASLYQSVILGGRFELGDADVHDGSRKRCDAPDGERQLRRIEANALQLARPDRSGVAHQIVDGDRRIVGKTPFPQRKFEVASCGMVRIETHRHEDQIA